MIFEFLKRDDDVVTEQIDITKKAFDLISNLWGFSHINQYNSCQIEQLFDNLFVLVDYGIKQLEKTRTGSNKFFPTEDISRIEVCLLTH
jgi:hypothetical protein